MDEPVKKPDLSPEQQNTAALIRQLLGKSMAYRYVDFCRLASGALPLRVSIPLAAHALRELESVLRQTLAGPMEIGADSTQDDLARVEAARKHLHAAGFNEDTINRAVKELLPRLSHKAQIQAIVTRLGLAADGDIARAWTAISQAHGKAHGRALYQSLAVDAEFRARWQDPFDTVMRGLMIALQGKYAALMQRVDQLAAMPDRGAAVTSFVKEIPGALPLLWHFFNQLQAPDWLPHLAKQNLLAAPTLPPDEDAESEGLLLRQWPAGRYLLRMANSPDSEARALIVRALRDVGASRHPDVHQIGIEVLAALPPDDAASLLDLAETWLTRDARFVMAQGPHDLLKRLALGGHAPAALRVARALFQVFDQDGQLGTLFSRHMYEHFLPGAVKALAPVCGVETVALLCDLLDQSIRISGRFHDEPPSDYTTYLSQQISEHGTKHDVLGGLISGIALAAKLAIETAPACTREVVLQINSHPARIFVRLALYVLSFNPCEAPELAKAYLTDANLIEAGWCRAEYAALARAWFPSLPAGVQEQILAIVDGVPAKYRNGWKERFEAQNNKPPTAENARKFNASVVRDLLWLWRSALPDERQAALTSIVEELGDPDAWRRQFDEPEAPPPAAPSFSSAPIDDIIAFLKTWRPPEDGKRETATALAQRLRNAAIENAAHYSANAARFIVVPLLYVRAVLEGLENAFNNRTDIDWDGAVALIAKVIQSSERPSGGLEGDDADSSWVRKAAADLLASGLRQGAQGIPFAHAALVIDLIQDFYRTAPRQPETEAFEESYRSYPFYGAKGTTRGTAVKLVLVSLFWLSKDAGSVVGRSPQAALDNLPAFRAILDAELRDVASSGRIPRAIIGRYLTWLFYFGESWVRAHLAELFPAGDVSLRDATWVSHLTTDSQPVKELAPEMRDCYVAEICRLGQDEGPGDHLHVEERLAEYLVMLYIWSALPNDVFELFWNTAPASARKHAMWFLGTQLGLSTDKIPKPFRSRAVSYWDRRLAAARASADPDHFREELEALGQFFIQGNIDGTWLMDQVLAMADGGFAPSEPYGVLDHLSKLSTGHPQRAVEVLAALVKNLRFDRWVYMTQQQALRRILENGLASGSEQARSFATEAISYLAALGDGGYLDLLPKDK
ncbi:hypothetical protein [Bradyrhizobium canariense]|nr:hypothetical protein [Bradyrhizobium canariense]OSI78079.1 hypothetical protein BSZ23_19965 [Bradyrhizobium canariense]